MSHNCKVSLEPTSDDTIQCFFFLPALGSDLSLWENLCQQLNNSIRTLTKDYIWHRDEFIVYLPIFKVSDKNVPIHLRSTTCFDDNLEDEWFIVHVALELSRQYKNLIIQMKDNDGDFLLIEAANYLQSWANPENTENRVCIFDGQVHIIPPEIASLETKLELEEALKIIINMPAITQASQDVQQAILNRIGSYPDKILELMHTAVVKLPCNLATLLVLKPALIAPIVDAYCNYDINDSKCCRNIEFDDCVEVKVKFTKFLYAKLMHSKVLHYAKKYAVTEKDKKTVLGLKLVCGLQIIMNKAANSNRFTSNEYQRFLNNLKQNGYFRNNIEGSKEYNQLLERAQHYFSTVECPISSNVYHTISEMMTSSDFMKVKDSIKTTSAGHLDYHEENEDWLNIHPEQLNELLHKRYGKKTKLRNNDLVTSQTITQELSTFLKKTSDIEGIELKPNENAEQNNINFESDKFISCLDKMLKIITTGSKEDSASIDSDEDFENMSSSEESCDDEEDNDDCDRELRAKLQNNQSENLKDKRTILANIIQSMKEEKASTGPTSNLMRCLGVSKTELLDSDDD